VGTARFRRTPLLGRLGRPESGQQYRDQQHHGREQHQCHEHHLHKHAVPQRYDRDQFGAIWWRRSQLHPGHTRPSARMASHREWRRNPRPVLRAWFPEKATPRIRHRRCWIGLWSRCMLRAIPARGCTTRGCRHPSTPALLRGSSRPGPRRPSRTCKRRRKVARRPLDRKRRTESKALHRIHHRWPLKTASSLLIEHNAQQIL
jgi:hypothetical protein